MFFILNKYKFLRTQIIKPILSMGSIYNAYKTLSYYKIMSVTMATNNMSAISRYGGGFFGLNF